MRISPFFNRVSKAFLSSSSRPSLKASFDDFIKLRKVYPPLNNNYTDNQIIDIAKTIKFIAHYHKMIENKMPIGEKHSQETLNDLNKHKDKDIEMLFSSLSSILEEIPYTGCGTAMDKIDNHFFTEITVVTDKYPHIAEVIERYIALQKKQFNPLPSDIILAKLSSVGDNAERWMEKIEIAEQAREKCEEYLAKRDGSIYEFALNNRGEGCGRG